MEEKARSEWGAAQQALSFPARGVLLQVRKFYRFFNRFNPDALVLIPPAIKTGRDKQGALLYNDDSILFYGGFFYEIF